MNVRPASTTSTTLLLQSGPGRPLRPRPRRLDGVLATLLSARLDARLVGGVAPGSDRLVAARAAQLVGQHERFALADAWEDLLSRAARPQGLVDARVPVARDAVRAATDEILDLMAVLRGGSPVAARDVARARVLLTSGRGPVYRPGLGLREAVADVAAALATTPG